MILIDIGKDGFAQNYHARIKDDSKLKELIVIKDPELSQRIFYVFRDEEIGRMFVKKYRKREDYHHSAYFVARELGIPFDRMFN